MDDGSAAAVSEVFALTDEQIVGLEAQEDGAERPASLRGSGQAEGGRYKGEGLSAGGREVSRSADSARNDGAEQSRSLPSSGHANDRPLHGESAQPGMAVPQWLAERMKDPWCGDEAREFWDGKQRVEREAAAYRELFATPEDARALKEIYPGGASEARTAAERARALDEIDAAFYRGDPAARTQLAKRMMAQDPAAFREMVEAGLRLLGEGERAAGVAGRDQRSAIGDQQGGSGAANGDGGAALSAQSLPMSGQAGVSVPQDVVRAYGEFEKSANAELEKSVGGAIARAMELALPNLRAMRAAGSSADDGAPLQDRLAGAVREEVEAGLKSDRQLGEQVARLLSGRRFDREARGQVVRLIDARARQLVPGAVKRVVSSWTNTTLAARGKEATVSANTEATRRASDARPATRNERPGAPRSRRVDYGRMSDDEIMRL